MKIKKLFFLSFILTIFITCCCVINPTYGSNNQDILNIYSDSVIIVENSTGKVLYEKNAEQKMYPASTTKIVTAILAIEKGNLKDKTTVSRAAIAGMKPSYSSAYLVEGEIMSVEDLLKVLLVHSANDASNVLAEYISGSIEKFVSLMNQKVQELGCNNTHFVTTNGLHDDNHYTTAKDLSIIARYCMKNSAFRHIVSMKTCTIHATNKCGERSYKNTNDLINTTSIYYYPYCVGIKTGYTSEAKNCLISACTKNRMQLIAVVLGATYTDNNSSARYIDSKTLYEYAYNNYSFETIAKANSIIDTIEVRRATNETKKLNLILQNDITALINNVNKNDISYEVNIDETLEAPIALNSVVGTVTYSIGGESYTENLLASHTVERDKSLITIIRIVFLILIVIIFIILIIIILKKFKKKN